MKNIQKMHVTHVIDHHKLGDLATSEQVYLRFEPVGCTATILTKLYRENSIKISPTMAFLLSSAIVSDTLHFRYLKRSKMTTSNESISDRQLLPTMIKKC